MTAPARNLTDASGINVHTAEFVSWLSDDQRRINAIAMAHNPAKFSYMAGGETKVDVRISRKDVGFEIHVRRGKKVSRRQKVHANAVGIMLIESLRKLRLTPLCRHFYSALDIFDGYVQDHAGELVYFIRDGEDGPIKIGRTNNLAHRLGILQTGNPRTLTVLAVTRAHAEKDLHYQFWDHRIRGEWFEPHPEIVGFAERVRREECLRP